VGSRPNSVKVFINSLHIFLLLPNEEVLSRQGAKFSD
jgi:hypothetical protein